MTIHQQQSTYVSRVQLQYHFDHAVGSHIMRIKDVERAFGVFNVRVNGRGQITDWNVPRHLTTND